MHGLTKSEAARLRAVGLEKHAEINRDFYIVISRRATIFLQTEFPDLNTAEDHLRWVSLLIEQSDPNIWGLHRGDLSIDEMCRLLAKTVVGHENEGQASQ